VVISLPRASAVHTRWLLAVCGGVQARKTPVFTPIVLTM
jgi:hypothetical protein